MHGQCRACASACPVGVLDVSPAALTLAEGCIACGRCAAACPTQALTLPELAALNTPIDDPQPRHLRMECAKVPQAERCGDTTVVPCLGALTAGHLLARHAAGHSVQIVDRGWCARCEAGSGSVHPAQAALDGAQVWLHALGELQVPTLVNEPLPLARMSTAPPHTPDATPTLERRSFFRAVLQHPNGGPRPARAATPMGAHGRAAYPADRRHPSPERERQLHALRAITGARGSTIPGEWFPHLDVDARCCDQRMCVALCPTAALTAHEDADSAALDFSAERCIACGACVRACPEGAMHLEPHGSEPATAIRRLASHARARCASCGGAFTPAHTTATAAQCPTCAKNQRFMADARRQLFGAET